MKRAYIEGGRLKEEFYPVLLNIGVEKIYGDINLLLTSLKPGDEIVISCMSVLNLTPQELLNQWKYFKHQQIMLHDLSLFRTELDTYLSILASFYSMEQAHSFK